MKKLSLFLTLLACATFGLNAQTVVFSENFDGVTAPAMPVGWTMHDVDGKTVYSSLQTVMGGTTASWVGCSNSTLIPAAGDKIALSTSYYTPAGAANDWMVTPSITIPTGTTVFTWDAKAFDPNYPDGYMVKVITSGTAPANYVTATMATIAAENNAWTTRSVNLSAYAGQSIKIAFQNTSNDMYLLGINNVKVVQPAASDAATTALNIEKYVSTGNVSIQGTIKNLAASNLTSVNINWNVNNGAPNTMVASVNLAYGATYNFTHTTPLNIATSGTYNVKVWVSNPNTGADVNLANDTLMAQVGAVSTVPVKHSILEEATGAWCQYCPDGAVILSQVLNTYPNAIGVSVHNSDGMAFTDGNTVNSAYISGYPQGTIDHYKFPAQAGVGIDRGSWSSLMGTRLGMIVPAEVGGSHTYNSTTRQLEVDVTATFRVGISGDFRVNCYLVEDTVVGPNNSQYNQVNYYNTVSGHTFFGKGNPMVGFKHSHVLRAMLGSAWGSTGTIPATTTDGGMYTKHYSYTIPATYGGVNIDASKMHIIYVVQEYDADANKRPIHNVMEEVLGTVSSVTTQTMNANDVNVYPNPFAGQTNVQINLTKAENVIIRVLDLSGKEVINLNQGTVGAGINTISVDANHLSSGMYLMNIMVGNQSITKKIEVR